MHLFAPVVWLLYVGNLPRELIAGALLGMATLIFVHELGHAVLVRAYRAHVVAIDFLPFGGECAWQGSVTALGHSVIAWGGVLAQALLLVVVEGVMAAVGRPQEPFLNGLVHMLTVSNVYMMVLNLVPIPPLDGSKAWLVVPRGLDALVRRSRTRQGKSSSRTVWQRLRSKFGRRNHLRSVHPADDEDD
ncbi:MAG: hypothetical protein JNM17_34645 [Archangium sp.]|nr:hypothetical protein [Archangium sp.]